MSRQAFIESHGASCSNWRSSWSFVNNTEKFIIFGAWDINTTDSKALILSQEWEIGEAGRKQPAYRESLEHIRMIEEEDYRLMTFAMKSTRDSDGRISIESFDRSLEENILRREGTDWYAIKCKGASDFSIPEELDPNVTYIEGASAIISVNSYERNGGARSRCIDIHGYNCAVCEFNFEKAYGVIGRGYIHVHHIVPIHTIKKEYQIDPAKDLIPVCPNCHAMIHKKNPPLSIEELKNFLNKKE